MDLKNFDKHIKSSLENIEEPFDANSWAALEQRMNTAFTEEQPSSVEPVDLVVKRSFERLDIPYRAADWSLLNNRLNQNALVRRIRLTKAAELAIFLLLLLNIEGFLGGFKEVLKPKAPEVPKSSMPMADNLHAKRNKHAKSGTGTSASNGFVDRVAALINTPFTSAVSSETLASSELPTIFPNKSVLDAANFYSTTGLIPFNKIAPLALPKTPEFAWNTFFDVIPGVTAPVLHRSNGMYAAAFANVDKNYIQSKELDSHQNGYGGGVAVGYRQGKWGVESGLSYAHKSFKPKKDVEIYAGDPTIGFLGAYVKNVDAEVFSIPVKVSRRLGRVGSVSAFAVGGISANVATEKRFSYKSVKIPASSPSPDPVSGPDPRLNPIPMKNNNGYLEGGSLGSNVYATAELGLRVEQPIGKRFVAFLEPSYHQSIGGGFGPNKERINTFSFQAGVMAAL